MITICQNCDKYLLGKLESFLNDEGVNYKKVECLDLCQKGISVRKTEKSKSQTLCSEKEFNSLLS